MAQPSAAIQLTEESLRIDGPVQSIWRLARREEPSGTCASLPGPGSRWCSGPPTATTTFSENPEDFLPERANATRHLTFGRGPHTCVGAGIARLEGRITLEVLAERLPELALVDDGGLTFRPSATQRIAQHLHVTW